MQPGTHGDRCQKRAPALPSACEPCPLDEEYATTLQLTWLQHQGPTESQHLEPPTMPSPELVQRCAYVVLLYGNDAEYALGALLVAFSLGRAGCQAHKLLLHTTDVPSFRLELLSKFYDEVRPILDPISLPSNSRLCSGGRDFAHPQFLKLHLLDLEFEKVLYLDCDVLVRRNLDHLFQLDAPAAMERMMAMPPHGTKLPNRVLYSATRVRGIQGGVMLLAPDHELFCTMRKEVEGNAVLDSYYQPSKGNEQDYLTWRYCQDCIDERDHPRVWTHLGCEYNYEVHAASMYFDIGRERWLWLDYEREAAVLHFSTPFRKRAKHLLRGPLGSAQDAVQESGSLTEDPRVAFAHRIWDAEVALLSDAVTESGEDLMTWLGAGEEAHQAVFVVIDRGAEGMAIVPSDANDAAFPTRLRFEAFTANCTEGLKYQPPDLAPGPPWGACFWAEKAKVCNSHHVAAATGGADEDTEAVEESTSALGGGDGHGGSGGSGKDGDLDKFHCEEGLDNGECVSTSFTNLEILSEARENVAGKQAKLRGATSADSASPGSQGEDNGKQNVEFCNDAKDRVAGILQDTEGLKALEDAARASQVLRCTCAEQNLSSSQYFWLNCADSTPRAPGTAEDGLQEIGAWIRRPGKDQWMFGLLSQPPHMQDCPAWRLFSIFRAKILET